MDHLPNSVLYTTLVPPWQSTLAREVRQCLCASWRLILQRSILWPLKRFGNPLPSSDVHVDMPLDGHHYRIGITSVVVETCMEYPLDPDSGTVRGVLERLAAQSYLVASIDLQDARTECFCVLLDDTCKLIKPRLFGTLGGQNNQEDDKSENGSFHTRSFLYTERCPSAVPPWASDGWLSWLILIPQ